jgi:hypothetical protein
MTTLFEPPATPALAGTVDALLTVWEQEAATTVDRLTATVAALETDLAHTARERDTAVAEAERTRRQLTDLLPASNARFIDLDGIHAALAQAHRPGADDAEAEHNRQALTWHLASLLPLAEALTAPSSQGAERARARAVFAQQQDYAVTADDQAHWEVTR